MIPRAMLAVVYATGRASHARHVKCDDTYKKGYPGPTGWGFGVGLTTPHIKNLTVTKHPQAYASPGDKTIRLCGLDWVSPG
jgi:hypothetical protein